MYKKLLFLPFFILLANGHINGADAGLPSINTTSTLVLWGDQTLQQEIMEFVTDGITTSTIITLKDDIERIGEISGRKISQTVGHLDSLLVNKNYRKKGFGSYLFKAFISHLQTMGCTKVSWSAIPSEGDVDNYESDRKVLFAWYEKLGAREVSHFIMEYNMPAASEKSADENKD